MKFDSGKPVAVVLIEKHKFDSVDQAFHAAQTMGFKGSHTAFVARLKKGMNTWAELCAPTVVLGDRNKSRETRQKKRDEMAEICARLDARKAQIAKEDT
jgi:hypothetical protein